MKRPGYREAIRWMVLNDDTSWVDDERPIITVTAGMVADLFDVEQARVIKDLRRELVRAKGGDA